MDPVCGFPGIDELEDRRHEGTFHHACPSIASCSQGLRHHFQHMAGMFRRHQRLCPIQETLNEMV